METYIYTYGTQKFEIERYKAEEMDLLKERIRNGLIKLMTIIHGNIALLFILLI